MGTVQIGPLNLPGIKSAAFKLFAKKRAIYLHKKYLTKKLYSGFSIMKLSKIRKRMTRLVSTIKKKD